MREDLLALDTEALAALANRGLVKRAGKDLEKSPPTLSEGEDVTAEFPDGTVAVLPASARFESADCTCAAKGLCRHMLVLVLAYQAEHGRREAAGHPAEITDEELAARFPAGVLARAESRIDRGLRAHVDGMTVELPETAVVFHGGSNLELAHSDVKGDDHSVAVVLAVKALREGTDGTVHLGAESVDPSPCTELLPTVESLLATGIAGADEVQTSRLRQHADRLRRKRLNWPADVLADTARQIEHYRSRSTAYDESAYAGLLAEFRARHDAALRRPTTALLGFEESSTAALKLIRLAPLGARVSSDDDHLHVEMYYAQLETGMTHVITRSFAHREELLTVRDVLHRRYARHRIADLAQSTVITEAAGRSAGRVLTLGTGRLARTQTLPLGSGWSEFRPPLRYDDPDELLAAVRSRDPGLLRDRVAVRDLVVVPVESIEGLDYDPAAQVLTVTLNGSIRLRAGYSAASPGRLRILEEALSGSPAEVSGFVSLRGGRLTLDPLAVVDGAITVPDLAVEDGGEAPAGDAPPDDDPLRRVLQEAHRALASCAHRGLSGLRPSDLRRLAEAADLLEEHGFAEIARQIAALGKGATAEGWHTAMVRVLFSLDEL